jgi:hypothetical protein
MTLPRGVEAAPRRVRRDEHLNLSGASQGGVLQVDNIETRVESA